MNRPRAPRPPVGPGASSPEGERLQKRLANAGVGSRREVEDWIRAGRLTVNGTPAVLGQRVVNADRICLDDRPIRQRAPEVTDHLYVAHRSPGEELRDELMQRLPKRAGKRFTAISPMPHQDGGLELLSADGALAAKLQRASTGMVSEFRVRMRGELVEMSRTGVLEGMLDDGTRVDVLTLEDGSESEGEGVNRWLVVRARGASGRQIRQLLERQGALVSRVSRTRFGSLSLTRDLVRGQFRRVEAEELQALLVDAGLKSVPVAAAADSADAGAAPSRRQGQRGARPDRADRADRSVRSDRAARSDRSAPAQRNDRRPPGVSAGRRTTGPSRRGPPDRAGPRKGR